MSRASLKTETQQPLNPYINPLFDHIDGFKAASISVGSYSELSSPTSRGDNCWLLGIQKSLGSESDPKLTIGKFRIYEILDYTYIL